MCVVGMRVGTKSSTVAVSRSLTIAELTGSRQPLATKTSVAGQQLALARIHSFASNAAHSTDAVNSKVRSGPRHGRTVVQMLQNSLVQKALNQELAANGGGSNCNKVAVSQAGKLSICSYAGTVC